MMNQETVLFEGNIPFRVFHFSHNLVWLLVLGWNVGILVSLLQTLGWRVKITSQRICLTRGIIARAAEEVEFYRVSDTSFDQGVLQRLVGVGSVTLISDDKTCPQLWVPIHDPETFREKIRGFVRTERERMKSVQID